MKQLIFVATVCAIVAAAAGQRQASGAKPGIGPQTTATPDLRTRTAAGSDHVSPNQFNPTTTITYTVPAKQMVDLRVFNLLGREIATLQAGPREAGVYTVRLDTGSLAGGIYFCRLQTGTDVLVKKMFLMK